MYPGCVKNCAQKGLPISELNAVSQRGQPFPRQPPGASYSCASCCPIGCRHITKPCTDQHEGRISIWKGPHRAGATADFPIEPLNDIVGTDPCPMLGGKVAIGQRLFNAVLHFLGRLLQLHFPQLGHHGLSFLTLAISTLSDLWYNGGD